MKLLESRTLFQNTLVNIVDSDAIFEQVKSWFDVLYNNVFSEKNN